MSSRRLLQAVFFDLDGTLRHNRPRAIDMFLSLVRQAGVRTTDRAAQAAERWQYAYWAESQELREDLSLTEGFADPAFWLRYTARQLRVLGVGEGDVEPLAQHIYARMGEQYQPQGFAAPGAAPLLEALSGAGYRLALVSNRDDPFDGELRELSLGGYFDLTLAAGEVGYWKPDGRLLLHAAERLGVLPERTVYVGDNWYADVPAAREAGMHPVLVDPYGLFPEADCPVVTELGELVPLIEGMAGDQGAPLRAR
jgi:putative hydrolase of the HAD superfamily